MRHSRLRRGLRVFLVITGPLGHLILGPLQAIAIGVYLAAIGWHVCVAWLAAIVLGFVPLVGPFFAAYAVYRMYMAYGARQFPLPLSPWYAIALFVVPPLLFVLAAVLARRKRFKIEPSTTPRVQIGPTPLGW